MTTLQNENSQLKKLVSALKSENAKLQKKIARIEAKYVTSSNRIKALEKLKELPEAKAISDFEVAKRIAFILASQGMHIVNSSGEKIEP